MMTTNHNNTKYKEKLKHQVKMQFQLKVMGQVIVPNIVTVMIRRTLLPMAMMMTVMDSSKCAPSAQERGRVRARDSDQPGSTAEHLASARGRRGLSAPGSPHVD